MVPDWEASTLRMMMESVRHFAQEWVNINAPETFIMSDMDWMLEIQVIIMVVSIASVSVSSMHWVVMRVFMMGLVMMSIMSM